MAISRQTAREAVERRLGIDRSTPNQPANIWSATEINAYLQEGLDLFTLTTGALWKKASPTELDDIASTATYTLPTEVYHLERCLWNQREIFPLDRRWLEAHHPNFESQTGDVFGYLLEGDGLRVLRKVNIPSETSTTLFEAEYIRRAATLSDSQGFEIPDRYVKFIRFFALWKCLERDGPGQDLGFADHYRTRYNLGVARILRRTSLTHAIRTGRMGGPGSVERNGPPRPRLPWNFGR